MKNAECSRPRPDDGGAHDIFTVVDEPIGGKDLWIVCRRCGQREKLVEEEAAA